MNTLNGSSTVRRSRRTKAQLADLDDVIVAVVADGAPMTLRGVYYQVVSRGAVDKTEAAYRAVGRRLLALRRSGRVAYSAITDGTRWITKPTTWTDVDEMLDDLAASYRRMLWHAQPVEVHVFTEKDAISGVLSPITARYDVPLGVLRGYSSESFAHSVAESIRASGKSTYLYQFGDHDPSGVDAWRDFRSKVTAFAAGADLHFKRVAVTEEQIASMNLPTRPTKGSDTRSKGFTGGSVDVDAIPAPVLRDLLQTTIEQHLDRHELGLTLLAERSEREGLLRLAGRWSA